MHLGLLTKESGFKIAENAFSGGPLGELVQWSDLITTLYLLGHDVRISASLVELKESVAKYVAVKCCFKSECSQIGTIPSLLWWQCLFAIGHEKRSSRRRRGGGCKSTVRDAAIITN